MIRIFVKTYKNILFRFPITIQAVQTGVLMGSGDVIAQSFVEQKSFKSFDLGRIGKFTLIGTFFVGPSLRIWYGVLEKFFGSKGRLAAVKKVVADQVLFAPTFLAFIMSVVSFSQGNSINEVTDRLKKDYPDVLKTNYMVWPAVQLLNFYLVPLQFQVVMVQIVAIFWNTYFSWKINKSIPAS